jgi:hypothetical protein
VAAQDQAFSTNYFRKKILKEESVSKCWLHKEYEKTTDQLHQDIPFWQKINAS